MGPSKLPQNPDTESNNDISLPQQQDTESNLNDESNLNNSNGAADERRNSFESETKQY